MNGLVEKTFLQQKVVGRIPMHEGGSGEGHTSFQTLFKRKHRVGIKEVLVNLSNEIDMRNGETG